MTSRVASRLLWGFFAVALAVSVASWATYRFWWRDWSECIWRMGHTNHDINCGGLVAKNETGLGKRHPHGWEERNRRGALLSGWEHCPLGVAYETSWVVGEHPWCPIHGDLNGKMGIVPHGPYPKRYLRLRSAMKWFSWVGQGALLLAISLLLCRWRLSSLKSKGAWKWAGLFGATLAFAFAAFLLLCFMMEHEWLPGTSLYWKERRAMHEHLLPQSPEDWWPSSEAWGGLQSTPLHLAAGSNDLARVRQLLAEGADINRLGHGQSEATPLWVAVESNHLGIVKVLLEHGADPNMPDRYSHRPLHVAAMNNNVDIMKALLAGDAILEETNFWTTALHWAASKDSVDAAQFLLSQGIDVDVRNSRPGVVGHTPLEWACDQGSPGVAELLIAEGADVNAAPTNGWTPLHAAVTYRRTNIIDLLLRKGADVNPKFRDGRTPLDMTPPGKIADMLAAAGGKRTREYRDPAEEKRKKEEQERAQKAQAEMRRKAGIIVRVDTDYPKGPADPSSYELCLVYGDGARKRLTDNGTMEHLASFSHDGRFISFIRRRDSNGDGEIDWDDNAELCLMLVSNRSVHCISERLTNAGRPSWHPAELRLVFFAEEGERRKLYEYDAANSTRRLMNGSPGRWPAWSHNGRYIAFFGAPKQIVVLDLKEESATILPDDTGNVWLLYWTYKNELVFRRKYADKYIYEPTTRATRLYERRDYEAGAVDQRLFSWATSGAKAAPAAP